MASVTVSPEHPLPNKTTRVVFNLVVVPSNFVRVWATVAPTGSSIDKRLEDSKDPRKRIVFYEGAGGADAAIDFTFDKGGKYTFVAQEYVKGSGYGGGYEGDPAGSDVEEKAGTETTLNVYVAQRVTQQIGPAQEKATLVIWVWNDIIIATYKSIHGEDSPAITANPATDRIKSAIESTSVESALLALVNQPVSSVVGSLSSIVSNYCQKWNAHIGDSVVHIDSDNANTLALSYYYAYGPNDLKDFVNQALSSARYHYSNNDKTGPDNGNYHTIADRPNTPVYQSANSFSDAYGAVADLWRCYELHRLSGSSHPVVDTTNSLSALPPLMVVHREFLNVITSANPTPPAAQSTGAQLLISGAGFKEA